MKVCEVCGAEEIDESPWFRNKPQMGGLHVCESCQEDRKHPFFEESE